jgi:membrane protease YdiL (CAAX protease family)
LQAFDSTPVARSSRLLQLALFITAGIWFFCSEALAAHAAQGISDRFSSDATATVTRPLLAAIFLLFLLTIGFSILQSISHRPASFRQILGLPKRPTSRREWMLGAAIGWGIVFFAVLPIALAGRLRIQLWTEPRAFGFAFLNLATLAVATLAQEVVYRGYAFRRLIEAIGPVTATIIMSLLFGLAQLFNPTSTWTGILITMLFGVLLSIAWLRTHGLWLAWGLHFAWSASMGVLFGLPILGNVDFSTVVQTRAVGRIGFTGGDFGPAGAVFTGLLVLIAIAVVVRVTGDYAWHYTHAPIVPGGYAVEAKPPAAHVAMEQQARPAPAPPALVQILPSTPQTRSVIDDPKP